MLNSAPSPNHRQAVFLQLFFNEPSRSTTRSTCLNSNDVSPQQVAGSMSRRLATAFKTWLCECLRWHAVCIDMCSRKRVKKKRGKNVKVNDEHVDHR